MERDQVDLSEAFEVAKDKVSSGKDKAAGALQSGKDQAQDIAESTAEDVEIDLKSKLDSGESRIYKTFEDVKESISSGTAHALEAIGLKEPEPEPESTFDKIKTKLGLKEPEPQSTIDAIKVKIGLKDPEPESTIDKIKSKISSGYESMKSGFQTGDRTE